MIPILHSPGVITPGQLGPISLVGLPARYRLVLIMSATGMPSVMATTRSRPEAVASMMASAAKGGGMYTTGHLCAVGDCLVGVELAGFPETLDEHPCVLVDEDAHKAAPLGCPV